MKDIFFVPLGCKSFESNPTQIHYRDGLANGKNVIDLFISRFNLLDHLKTRAWIL